MTGKYWAMLGKPSVTGGATTGLVRIPFEVLRPPARVVRLLVPQRHCPEVGQENQPMGYAAARKPFLVKHIDIMGK